MSEAKKLARAIQLLGEIRSQDFISEFAWDSKELCRWIKKTDRLLDSECVVIKDGTK